MFVPGFLTLEALLGSQITVLSPEQVRVTKEVPPLVSAQTGAISEKKGSWASKVETSGALGFYHLCCSTESHLAPESGD